MAHTRTRTFHTRKQGLGKGPTWEVETGDSLLQGRIKRKKRKWVWHFLQGSTVDCVVQLAAGNRARVQFASANRDWVQFTPAPCLVAAGGGGGLALVVEIHYI
jgi:hypothetical protein